MSMGHNGKDFWQREARNGAKHTKNLIPHQGEARAADGLVLAQRAAAGAGEAVTFAKHKAAVFAHRRDDLKTPPGPGARARWARWSNTCFSDCDSSCDNSRLERLLRQKFFHGLAHGAHGGIPESFSPLPLLGRGLR